MTYHSLVTYTHGILWMEGHEASIHYHRVSWLLYSCKDLQSWWSLIPKWVINFINWKKKMLKFILQAVLDLHWNILYTAHLLKQFWESCCMKYPGNVYWNGIFIYKINFNILTWILHTSPPASPLRMLKKLMNIVRGKGGVAVQPRSVSVKVTIVYNCFESG